MNHKRCSFTGCFAHFDPELEGKDDKDGLGRCTGWYWPDGTLELEDDDLPTHDHKVGE